MLESVTTSSYFFLTNKKFIFIKPGNLSQYEFLMQWKSIFCQVLMIWEPNQNSHWKKPMFQTLCNNLIWFLLINKIFWPLKTGHNVQITSVPLARIKNLSLRPSLKMSFLTTGIWYTTPIVSRISILSLYHFVITGMNISL